MEEGWLALELNEPAFENERFVVEFVTACQSTGGRVRPFCWITRNFTAPQARVLAQPFEAVILEAEIPAQILESSGPVWNPQAQDWSTIAAAFGDYGRDKAVATSFAPFQSYELIAGRWELLPNRSIAAPLIASGWYCLPYVYPAEHPGATISSQLQYARHYGPEWSHAEPVLGCYGGFTLDDFPERNACPGWSIWDAGEVL